jgi:hypothetical protein
VNDSDWEDRYQDQCRRLGTSHPRCSVPGCDEANPFALTGVHPNELCYEHRAEQEGRTPFEGHHSAGHHNAPHKIVITPGNDHRVLSEHQRDWPEKTLRNPDQNPLIRAAAALRGWLDLLRVVIERTVGWIPGFLEWLEDQLCDRLGTRWWDQLGWTGES